MSSVWPYSSDRQPPHGRRVFPRNAKELNIFSPSYYLVSSSQTPSAVSIDSTAEPGERRSNSQPGRRGHYTNVESTATREFASRGVRRVPQTPRAESAHGVRSFPRAEVAAQHIQVVNITKDYKDPMKMVSPRPGLRCSSARSVSHMKDILEYRSVPEQMRGEAIQVPVGVSVMGEAARHARVNYSDLEKFCQAVRDHCRQRTKGITQFYVLLCRNMVGRTTASTPPIVPTIWELEKPPEIRHLTLLRCRDQLVSLTCIPVTLRDLAIHIWGPSSVQEEDKEVPDKELETKQILFTDFANAFGENTDCRRLAMLKIA